MDTFDSGPHTLKLTPQSGEDRVALVAQVCQLGIQRVDIGLYGRHLLHIGCERSGVKFPDLQSWVDLLPGFGHRTHLGQNVTGEGFAGRGHLLCL